MSEGKIGYKLNTLLSLVIVLAIFGVIFSMLILTGDDFYFNGMTFQEIKKFVFTYNGRYLGNILGIFISGSVMRGYGWIRWLFMTCSMVFLAYVLMRKMSYRLNWLIVVMLFIIPLDNWREIYNWTPGFVNYLIPLIGVIYILSCYEKILLKARLSKVEYMLCLLIEVLVCLFMETVTLYMLIVVGIFTIYCIKEEKKKTSIVLLLPVLLGNVLMFSNSGYRNVLKGGDNAHSVGIDIENIKNILVEIIEKTYDFSIFTFYMNPIAVTVLGIILFYFIIKKFHKLTIGKKIITVSGCVVMTFTVVLAWYFSTINNYHTAYNLRPMNVLILATIGVLYIVCIAMISWLVLDDNNVKYKIVFNLFSIVLFFVPMIILNPDCARSYYFGNVFFNLVIIEIMVNYWESMIVEVKILLKTILLISGGCVLFFVGGMMKENYDVYEVRLAKVTQQWESGVEFIEMEILPYPELATNELRTEYGAYFYNKEKFDIQFILNGQEKFDLWK